MTRLRATPAVLGLDLPSTQIFGEAEARLENHGRRLADADLFIGAVAAVHGAVVVTAKRRRYDRIPGVAVEDWMRE